MPTFNDSELDEIGKSLNLYGPVSVGRAMFIHLWVLGMARETLRTRFHVWWADV